MKALPPAGKKALKTDQDAWNTYKKAEMGLIDQIMSLKEGTMYSNIRDSHRNQIAVDRHNALKSYIEILND